MNEINKTKLSDQTKFRIYEIKKIENFFVDEIRQRKLYRKKVNKYDIVFDYIDKILIVLSATSGEYQLFHLQVLLEDQLELQVQVLP